ncbi:stalk domain-containing protein [Paenibacillus motobuensis]|uniref:Copper amine oxidase-like N-terminal domain-containing protein n=1 Tax=Paenibacillus motobuensis TaxID=295324 RepID=A0ABN0Y3J5_9BACL
MKTWMTKKSMIALGVAGGLLISGAGVTQLAHPVQAAQGVAPSAKSVVEAAISNGQEQKFTIKTKTLTSNSPYLKAQVKIPVVEGLKDTQYGLEMNDIIERNADKAIQEWEKLAAEGAKEAKENKYEFRPYELYIDYEVKSDGSAAANPQQLLSFVVTQEGFSGGTSAPVQYFYNVWNKAEAERVTLEELFGANYKNVLDKQIREQMAKQPENYFSDEFKGIDAGQEEDFYVKDGKAVIVFPKYSIAPGAAGTPEFSIALTAKGGDNEAAKASVVINKSDYYTNKKGQVMIPLRSTAEGLGFKLTWNAKEKRADLTKNAVFTSFELGKDQYFFNKVAPFSLGAAPELHNKNMYVPVEFISKVLQGTIEVAENGAINVTHK